MKGLCFLVGLATMTLVGVLSFGVFALYLYQIFTHAQQFAFLW